eukprot:2560573-Rhodomonas_salina.3
MSLVSTAEGPGQYHWRYTRKRSVSTAAYARARMPVSSTRTAVLRARITRTLAAGPRDSHARLHRGERGAA